MKKVVNILNSVKAYCNSKNKLSDDTHGFLKGSINTLSYLGLIDDETEDYYSTLLIEKYNADHSNK